MANKMDQLKPTDLTFQMYVKVTAPNVVLAIQQLIDAELEAVTEGIVHIEPSEDPEEEMTVIFGIQDSEVEHYGKDLDKLHDLYDLPDWPNLPIIDIEDTLQ